MSASRSEAPRITTLAISANSMSALARQAFSRLAETRFAPLRRAPDRSERSNIPAKGDRGLSGSAMLRSYSQAQRTTRGRIARHLPLRPGPADDVQRRLVPRRGWEKLDIG